MKKPILILVSLGLCSFFLDAMQEVVTHNKKFEQPKQIKRMSNKPQNKLVFVTCMDTRINPYKHFGLDAGQAHVLRNAGGIITQDMVRSIILSMQALGTREIMVVGHTDCGVQGLNNASFTRQMIYKFKTDTVTPQQWYGFDQLQSNVRHQMQKIRSHPWIPKNTQVRGFIFDVQTAKLKEVFL